jgi:hypothetical protein
LHLQVESKSFHSGRDSIFIFLAKRDRIRTETPIDSTTQ